MILPTTCGYCGRSWGEIHRSVQHHAWTCRRCYIEQPTPADIAALAALEAAEATVPPGQLTLIVGEP